MTPIEQKGHYSKENKADTERQILYNFTYIWKLKGLFAVSSLRQNNHAFEARPGLESKFKTGIDYIVRSCFKIKFCLIETIERWSPRASG